MKVMIIDIGSNTIKTDIFKTSKKSKTGYKKIAKDSKAIKLIKYIDNGILSDKGKKKLFNVLVKFKKLARRYSCKNIVCIATAGFRKIAESKIIAAEIEERLKLTFHIITGDEEAELSFLGMSSLTKNLAQKGLMADMGGGSTEIVGFKNSAIISKTSCPFGCLYLKERFVRDDYPVQDETTEIKKEVNSVIGKINFVSDFGGEIYLVGGTAKAVATLHNVFFNTKKSKKIRFPYIINKNDFEKMLLFYLDMNKEKGKALKRLFPDRYTLVLPGMIAYLELFNLANIKTIHITTGGIRDGYMNKIIKEKSMERANDEKRI